MWHRLFWALLGAISVVDALDKGEIWADDYSHVVVIPDVHGDKDALLRSLWLAQKKIEPERLVDFSVFKSTFDEVMVDEVSLVEPLSKRKDVVLVQLGDLVDRGPYSRDCILLMDAVTEVVGWRVVRLYGNHELLALTGKGDRYVHPFEFAEFGGKKQRDTSFSPQGLMYDELIDNFLGVARINTNLAKSNPIRSPNTLFVHGGVDLEWLIERFDIESNDIDDINTEVTDTVTASRTVMAVLNEENSIVWDRDLASLPESAICGEYLDAILDHFEVARIIVGHTPQVDGIPKTRCDDRIILADVMMSRWMLGSAVDETAQEGGNPIAIIIKLDPDTQELESITAHKTDLRTGRLDEQFVLVGLTDAFAESAAPAPLRRSPATLSLADLDAAADEEVASITGSGYDLFDDEDDEDDEEVVEENRGNEDKVKESDDLGTTASPNEFAPILDWSDELFGFSGNQDPVFQIYDSFFGLPQESAHQIPDLASLVTLSAVGAARASEVGGRKRTRDSFEEANRVSQPVQGALVEESPYVRIVQATLGTATGVMNIFGASEPSEDVLARLQTISQMPRVVSIGSLADSSGASFAMLETPCQQILHQWVLSGKVVDSAMLNRIASVAASLHEAKIVIGLGEWQDIFNVFGVSADGSSVDLIDWSRLAQVSDERVAFEKGLVALAMLALLPPIESSETA